MNIGSATQFDVLMLDEDTTYRATLICEEEASFDKYVLVLNGAIYHRETQTLVGYLGDNLKAVLAEIVDNINSNLWPAHGMVYPFQTRLVGGKHIIVKDAEDVEESDGNSDWRRERAYLGSGDTRWGCDDYDDDER